MLPGLADDGESSSSLSYTKPIPKSLIGDASGSVQPSDLQNLFWIQHRMPISDSDTSAPLGSAVPCIVAVRP